MRRLFSPTSVFMVVVLALGGYTYYEYKNAARDLDAKKGERTAFTLKREAIQSVELKSANQQIKMVKKEGHWEMTQPVTDRAESSAIDGFLFTLLNQRLTEFQAKGEKINWAEFGLETPAVTLTLSDGKSTETLAVSTKNAFDGSYYVRQGDRIELGDKGLAQLIHREASSFRDRRLWREGFVEPMRVEASGKDHPFAFVKKQGSWVMEPDPGFALDQFKIRDWIEKVQELSAFEVVKETPEEAEKKILSKPVYQVSVYLPEEKSAPWVLTFGAEAGDGVLMKVSNRPTVYRIQRSALGSIWVTRAHFRDGKVPFHFDLELAREIRVRGKSGSHTFKKSESEWKLVGGQEGQQLDSAKLVQTFERLKNLEATEFFEGSKAAQNLKFEPPQVQILDADGKSLLTLSLGSELKREGQTLRYVKINALTVAVAKESLNQLVDDALVTTKAKQK